MHKKRTLFLDRDGVINRNLPNRYVKNWEEFEWCPGWPIALVELRAYFSRIIIITNQQGVGKGMMTMEALELLHACMCAEFHQIGAFIDAIICCPHLKELQCTCRKPGIGMFIQAREMFPEIDFANSWFIGDSVTDMEAARTLGITPVWMEHETNTGLKPGFVLESIHSIHTWLEQYILPQS